MPEYITSRKNEKLLHIKRLGSEKEYRQRCRAFVCDSEKMLQEALRFGGEVEMIVTCREDLEHPVGVPTVLVPPDVLESVAPVKTPQSVIFSCAMKPETSFPVPGGTYILLENVQDPGNVGTVIRTAGAFGIDGVILVGACADLYHPRTVRATMGAIFRMDVFRLTLDQLRRLKSTGLRLCGASLGENSRDVRQAPLAGMVTAVGSEGRGLSPELLELCDEQVIIPMRPECESLNAAVAASVLMWEMRREVL